LEIKGLYLCGYKEWCRSYKDGIIVSNENVNYAKKVESNLLLFKVDFEKAFDSINWIFLIDVMKQMDFGAKWCSWKYACLSFASISIIVNEALQVMVIETCNKGIFNGLSLAVNGANISLLQYAYDALFFGEWSKSNATNLIYFLECYHEVSGLKVKDIKEKDKIGAKTGQNQEQRKAWKSPRNRKPFPFILQASFSSFNSIFHIPPRWDTTWEETRLIKRLLYDNSSPRPLEEFIFENFDAAIESFSPFPIPVEDSDSFMEEIDLSFTSDDPIPPGIEEDDYDSESDILILEELLSNDSLSFPKNESFHFDIPSSSRPPAKPSDGNLGILNVKVMGDISEHKVLMPRLMLTQPTLVPNQEKSPNLLSHLGHEVSQPSTECPMTPIMDILFLHFYPH
nr:putative RNA-directed DNA polymerase, eukaryota [Tanacetum cinerariifolium]